MSQSLRSSQGSVEERFSHILQPIRDLAKNWDVDIAHFLEEYLEDLDKIEITFDDGVTTMNFSEAALLIQGSAGVYAKKVEYFHALVYQVLDLVTQKKKTTNQCGNNEGESADSTQQTGEDVQYLPLNDIPDTEGCYFKEQDVSTNKSVRPIPEMPTRLIPLEEAEKGDNCLLNKKGEVMGNHCDFNIDTGFITADGSILLEMMDKGLIEMLSKQQETFQAMVQEDFSQRQDGSIEGPAAVIEENDYQPENMDRFNNVTEAVHMADALQKVQSKITNEAPLRKSQRKRVEFVHASSSKKSSLDPWVPSDPHKKTKAVEKPLIRKKPFKIPAGLTDSSSKKRKKKTVVKTELPPLHEVVEKLFSHRPKFPRNPLKVPELPELEDAFWQEYKLREVIKKEEIKRLKKEEREEIEAIETEINDEEPDIEAFDAEEDDDIPLMPMIRDMFPENQDLGNIDRFRLQRGNSSVFSEEITLSYEDLVQKHVEKFLASAAEYAQITELSRRVSEWEDKIQPRLLEEESHEPFDIHRYGTFILEQLVRGLKKPFKELVKGKQEFEICRYTLATLQLANVYNVELSIVPDKPGNTMDCLYVTLLSTKRHFEELEDYMAPSLKAA